MEQRILELLNEIRPEFDFKTSNDFIEDGFLDSFDLVTLVDALDKEFSIHIDGMDIVAENFANIDTIQKLIKKNGAK